MWYIEAMLSGVWRFAVMVCGVMGGFGSEAAATTADRQGQPDPALFPVVLTCVEAPSPAQRMACSALEKALSARVEAPLFVTAGPVLSAPGQTSITLEIVRAEATFLLGRLVWSQNGAAPENGPVLEISVMDTEVSAATFDRLAEAVLKASDVPI